MNKVEIKNSNYSISPTHYPDVKTFIEDITLNNENQFTAFIGTVGSGEYGLYFITFEHLVFAADPCLTWNKSSINVVVDRFCDVEIKEIW